MVVNWQPVRKCRAKFEQNIPVLAKSEGLLKLRGGTETTLEAGGICRNETAQTRLTAERDAPMVSRATYKVLRSEGPGRPICRLAWD